MAQEVITFECSQCKNRNYSSTKNKKKNPDKLELKKFCKTCKKHTPHKEIKS
ncbi:MAG: 50S ribosomal protein L33 [Candidatus Omnitrophota bacterium]